MTFSNISQEIKPEDRVVYLDGSFDLFNPAHVEIIKKAKQLGDFLIVGVFDDTSLIESY